MDKLIFNGEEISRDSDLSMYKFSHIDSNNDTHLVKKSYKEYVNDLIREKYDINEEFAILRQRETKTEEFEEYNSYVEDCKAKAKEILKLEVDNETNN